MREGEGEGEGGGGYFERKYEFVLRGEHDMLCAVLCAGLVGWGCV